MSKIFKPTENENVVFTGDRIEVVHQKHSTGTKTINFEWGQRPPGVRVLAQDNNGRILLTKEFRYEQADYDYRLPGGKVADTLEDWHAQRKSDKGEQHFAEQKAIAEAKEEAGLDVKNLSLIEVVPDGTTFKWDLYYFYTSEFSKVEQNTEHGEDIETGWYSTEEITSFIKEKKIKEGRTVYILAPYVL